MHEESLGNWARRASLYVVLLLTSVVAGCEAADKDQVTAGESAASSANPNPLCSLESVKCGSTTTTAAATIDYAIFKGATTASKGLVLVEPGGPGFDLYARGDVNFMALPANIQSYDRLLLREPWAQQGISTGCTDTLRNLGDAMSKNAASLPRLDSACALKGWSATGYRQAVQAVLAAEKREIAGIVGQSYGALPAAEAARDHPTAWLVLNAPIAPASMSGEDLVKGRQAAFQTALDSSYAEHCTALKADCSKTGTAVADAATSRMTDQTLSDRSAPLRAGDVGLAIMGAAYDLDSNGFWLWETLTVLPQVDAKDWSTLARLSDQLIQRSGGGGELSPRMAAYFAGICQSYTGWPQPDGFSSMPLLLRAIIVQCFGSSESAAWTTEPVRRQAATCLYLNKQDPVARAEDGAAWEKVFPEATVDEVSHNAHISLDRALQQKANGASCRIQY